MGRTLGLPVLESARIAAPCPARWEEMAGDDRTRFCAMCGLHVHNVAAMTREEAEALLARAREGRVCARVRRRADGTIITSDCPVGVRLRDRARRLRISALAALGLVGLLITGSRNWRRDAAGPTLRDVEPLGTLRTLAGPLLPDRRLPGAVAPTTSDVDEFTDMGVIYDDGYDPWFLGTE